MVSSNNRSIPCVPEGVKKDHLPIIRTERASNNSLRVQSSAGNSDQCHQNTFILTVSCKQQELPGVKNRNSFE
ncbi:UNVERIFIED_CONTAM: hypothetical protein FKN15_035110 [Acipenser sinensis]